ncbi:MAG: hypothetical protein V1858_02115 [Candidatus Gottesmanbacteria bacterium]
MKNTEDTQRVNLFLDPEMVKRAKIQAVKERLPLSKLIDKIIKKHCPEE